MLQNKVMTKPPPVQQTAGVLSRKVTRDLPVNWGQDSLSEFWGKANDNMIANFADNPADLERVRQIDAAFSKIAENQIQPQNMLVSLLLIRTHSAFRAASILVMAGMPTDSHPQIRSVLEHAGYALLIHRDSTLGETWLRRQEGVQERRAVKAAFGPARIKTALDAVDVALSKIWSELYEHTIDSGAHPNERSLTANLSVNESGRTKEYRVQYLHGDSIFVKGAIRTLARTGLCALHVLQHTMTARFELLGLKDEVRRLRRGL